MVGVYRRPLSAYERTIPIAYALVAGTFGVFSYLAADDPDFGDLQRLLVVILIGLWVLSIAAVAAVARFVDNRWSRAAILLAGPIVAITLSVASTMLRLQ